ncbi:MAG: tRNA-intron lyase [Candidatus Brockarchaeota archaeon]|nr:tRNA-intron lyase [Candidatus Brockarchaeota archaeon]
MGEAPVEELVKVEVENYRVTASDSGSVGWLASRGFGYEYDGARVLYPYEVLYLLSIGKLRTESGGALKEPGSFEEFLAEYKSSDKLIWTRYLIYRDLRSRGYVVREGYGFNIDFRVYERGEYGSHTSKYLIYGICEGEPVKFSVLSELIKRVQSLRKTLILAVVDRRSEVVYYTVSKLNS